MAKKQSEASSRSHSTKAALKKRQLESYQHADSMRLNNLPVGLVNPASDPVQEPAKYRYDPHADPELNFAPQGDLERKLEACYAELDSAIASGDSRAAQAALSCLRAMRAP